MIAAPESPALRAAGREQYSVDGPEGSVGRVEAVLACLGGIAVRVEVGRPRVVFLPFDEIERVEAAERRIVLRPASRPGGPDPEGGPR